MIANLKLYDKTFLIIVHRPPPLGSSTYLFEIPSKLVFSLNHLLKAVELTIQAKQKGESLRNLNLEIIRRLVIRKQVKKIMDIVSVAGEKNCIIEIYEEPIVPEKTKMEKCEFGGKRALDIIFGGKNIQLPDDDEKIEELLLSLQSLSITGKWFFD